MSQRLKRKLPCRATGPGSRLPFDNGELESRGWEVIRTERPNGSVIFRWRTPDPERILLKTSKEVTDFLERTQPEDSDMEYVPSSSSQGDSQQTDTTAGTPVQQSDVQEVCIPNFIYLAMSHKMLDFLDEINSKLQCRICGNNGKLVPVHHKEVGLGGATEITFQCFSCASTIHYASSMMCVKETKRNAVSLATALAFLIWGRGYAGYYNVLMKGLGIKGLSKPSFYKVIEFAYPHVKAILDKACEDAKDNMRRKENNVLGSWKRAVTTSDGCWLIRGFHSQCASFVVIDFICNALLFYGHLCMRGSNNICDVDLWGGTSKAAEGHLAHLCFTKAKEEGMHVEINWQDADSSSGSSFRSVFPDGDLSRVMLCGGHVGRSHSNNLKEYKSKRIVDQGFLQKRLKEFPDLKSVKCYCSTRHSKSCGCFTDAFLASAKRNHFCVLKQCGSDPNVYAERMMKLGKYHARDIHSWTNEEGETEEYGFHPQKSCSCEMCSKAKDQGSRIRKTSSTTEVLADSNIDSDEESDKSDDDDGPLECDGSEYRTRAALTCPLHALLYEIECQRLAKKASQVIDPEMGRGHSNLPESRFSVLSKFRPKYVNLHQLHYEVSTNIGLLQGNMSWSYRNYGPHYHWEIELYDAMGLPMVAGLRDQLVHDNEVRFKKLEAHKTDHVKTKRTQRKKERLAEQNRRKRYSARQKILHTYGEREDVIDENDRLQFIEQRGQARVAETQLPIAQAAPENAVVRIGGPVREGGRYRFCRCGATNHQRISHRDCPLNTKSI